MGDNSRCLISAQARARARKWGGERLWNRQSLTEGGEEGRGVAERRLRIQHGARPGRGRWAWGREGGKKLEAAGGLWAKWGFLFVYASQHSLTHLLAKERLVAGQFHLKFQQIVAGTQQTSS